MTGWAWPRAGASRNRRSPNGDRHRTDAAVQELERVKHLHSYAILDTPPEEAFDRIARLASRVLTTPVCLVSFVDSDRQWFKSRIGLEVNELPRDIAFCDHLIRGSDMLVVEDAAADPRFRENPLVTDDPGIRSYAGAALTTEDGYRIGTLCVFDQVPRAFSEDDRGLLEDLADLVVDELELRRLASVARSAEQNLFEAIDALSDGFVLYDRHDRLVICNRRYREIYSETADLIRSGVRFEDMIRKGAARGQYPDAIGREEDWVRERVRQHQNPQGPIEQKLPDGTWLRIDERRTREGGLVGFRTDITELKRREEELKQLATTDELTGLPNRNDFHDRLAGALANAKRTGRLVGLMFMDLDRFKNVNDTLGHGVGDELLKMVAKRLRACCRETDIVARLGGDEFAVIVTNIEEVSGVTVLADRIIAALEAPFSIKGQEIESGTSIGIAIYPDDFSNIKELMSNADLALYRAKDHGRGCWQLYDKAMQAQAQYRSNVERDLRKAIETGDLVLHFQPQVDVNLGRITGAEALVRWTHPEWGPVSPEKFVPIAESTRLIIPIGEYVLREACRQNRAWQEAGLPPIVSAVNVSPIEFRQSDFVDRVCKVLKEESLDPALLELEITEKMAMDDRIDPMSIFRELKALGVKLSIDDFGTGYSSLSRLKDFPVDRLKIDRSFVDQISTDWDGAVISSSVIRLGHTLNLGVIAEGVETEEQLKCLIDFGCTEMQGYYFSKPLPADEFVDFVRSFEVMPAGRASA
ncbi:MAG: EAL domain-containing protein [Alphaproteobacteria bacterium]|nr:EAL domain-containing protein [Alphaproteobacteria bacterium]